MLELYPSLARPTGLAAAARAALALTAGALSACSAITFGIANAPATFGSVRAQSRLRVWRARSARRSTFTCRRQKVPQRSRSRIVRVVVFWYGGSWQRGSKSDYRFVGAALAERGFITVLPDYRLYPDVKFPDFLDDAAHAVAWVQQHAQEFGGDPHRMVLMGHSAGAHTAAFLALNRDFLAKRGAKPEWIAGLVGLSGPYAFWHSNTRALNRIFAAPWGESDWQPVRFVTSQAPPTFIAHGLERRPRLGETSRTAAGCAESERRARRGRALSRHRARRHRGGLLEAGARKRADAR